MVLYKVLLPLIMLLLLLLLLLKPLDRCATTTKLVNNPNLVIPIQRSETTIATENETTTVSERIVFSFNVRFGGGCRSTTQGGGVYQRSVWFFGGGERPQDTQISVEVKM